MNNAQAEVKHWMLVEPIINKLEKKLKDGVTTDEAKDLLIQIRDMSDNTHECANSMDNAGDELEELLPSLSSEPSTDPDVINKLDNCIDYLREIGY